MAEYSYSPEASCSVSESEHSERTIRKKSIFSAFLLIVTSGFLLFSEIWYANVVGIAGAFLGIYGAFKKNTKFVFVYMQFLI